MSITLDKFLTTDELSLPKTRKATDGSYQAFLEHCFSNYRVKIDLVNSTSRYLEQEISQQKYIAFELCEVLKNIVDEYLRGFPNKAYSILETFLNDHNALWKPLISPSTMNKQLEYLYRMRIGEGQILTKKDLFHIPFQLRSKVQTQRYSIPGLPCLYVGGSLYVCWEEMGRPVLAHTHIARIATHGLGIKILDLGFTPHLLNIFANQHFEELSTHNDITDFIKSNILLWPLLVACSIRVLEPFNPFKVEYIIPQLVLQWITSEKSDIDGIRYFSTHIDYETTTTHFSSNYAFPAKTNADMGFCSHLMGKFQMTEPLSWEFARAVKPPSTSSPNAFSQIQVAKGVVKGYLDTEFELMECYLNIMQCSPM
jgi:hypothetical protein